MSWAPKMKSWRTLLLTLLIVGGVFSENSAWGFFAEAGQASGKIPAQITANTGENEGAWQYDASGYAVASKNLQQSRNLVDDTLDPLPMGQDVLDDFVKTDPALQGLNLRVKPTFDPSLADDLYGQATRYTAIDLESAISPKTFRNRRQLVGTIAHEDLHLRIGQRIDRGSQRAFDLRRSGNEEAYVIEVERRFLEMQRRLGR